MKHANNRTLASLVAAAVVVAILGFGSGITGVFSSGSPVESTASSVTASQSSHVRSDAPYTFRTSKLLKEHFNKHGKEMGFSNAKEYEAAASAVVANPDSLHKFEKEDNDDVYYLQATDELVIVSTDGYIRTYFNPGGIGYFNRQ